MIFSMSVHHSVMQNWHNYTFSFKTHTLEFPKIDILELRIHFRKSKTVGAFGKNT